MTKHVYRFSEGNKDMRELLGGKGANLAEMTRIGMPVPPGFTITTEVCNDYYDASADLPRRAWTSRSRRRSPSSKAITGKKFGDAGNPLLRQRALGRPRSHARHDGHRPQPGPERHDGRGRDHAAPATRASPTTATAASCSMFGDVVLGCKPGARRARPVRAHPRGVKKKRTGVKLDTDLDRRRPQGAGRRVQGVVKKRTGKDFPEDPLRAALGRHQRRLRQLGGTTAPSNTAG